MSSNEVTDTDLISNYDSDESVRTSFTKGAEEDDSGIVQLCFY